VLLISSYDIFGGKSLLPLKQEEFATTDSQTASLKTSQAVSHAIAFTGMWLFGDFLPKKIAFLASMVLWILLSLSATLVTSHQFWLYVVLHALASVSAEVFRILVNVLQAEHFKGKYLTGAITAGYLGNVVAVQASSTINSIFVSNHGNWRWGALIGPVLSIPVLILSAIFLRSKARESLPKPVEIFRNALGVLRIPTFLLISFSQCFTMFYSLPLSFWMSTLTLLTFENFPSAFLGVSYPVVSSLTTSMSVVGMAIGAFLLPYAAQSLESGSGMFSCLPATPLAFAIFYAFSSALETLSYITQLIMMTTSLPLFAAGFFMDGLAGSGIQLFNLQITLIVAPSNKCASALSLLRLMTAIGDLPSAQIIAAISDYFRGDSTDPVDRLNGLRKAFLYTWFMPVVSTIMCFVVLRFYKRDVEKAREIDQIDDEEKTPLLTEKSSVQNFS
ncbi:hypothetical protein PENTCL1PPCAC_5266, partial [Pristionchus entomophagus]